MSQRIHISEFTSEQELTFVTHVAIKFLHISMKIKFATPLYLHPNFISITLYANNKVVLFVVK